MNISVEQSFWSKVVKSENCWEWQGALSPHGYGTVSVQRKNMRAHRFSWELHNSPIPPGMVVCHKCDNPKCVRPDHLFVGTQRDNMHDAIQKGRFNLEGSKPQTHCRKGHLFGPDNTRIRATGHKLCRICYNARKRERRALTAALKATP